jgi:hypothetical protein
MEIGAEPKKVMKKNEEDFFGRFSTPSKYNRGGQDCEKEKLSDFHFHSPIYVFKTQSVY